jgi:hypothetical protein
MIPGSMSLDEVMIKDGTRFLFFFFEKYQHDGFFNKATSRFTPTWRKRSASGVPPLNIFPVSADLRNTSSRVRVKG